jgi:Rrf2 family protein
MRLTRGADYALRVMIYMSGTTAAHRLSRSAIAAATHIPEAYLAKILQALVKVRLIRSRPGVHGGFELSRTPSDISMLEVIEAIDGPSALATCIADENSCEQSPWCGVRHTLAKAQEAMLLVLKASSVADLVEQSLAHHSLPLTMIETAAVTQ